MGLPSTGSISMSQVNTELKKASNAAISLNDSAVRKLAGKTSGTISMGDLRGKKASESVTNYQIYSNSFSGIRKIGNVTVTLPKVVISGKIRLITRASDTGGGTKTAVYLFGKTYRDNNDVYIALNNGIKSFNFEYDTGSGIDDREPKTLTVTIKFTGEWEA